MLPRNRPDRTDRLRLTLGTFLRSFRWGHARQLHRVSRELLARAWAAGAGPRAVGRCEEDGVAGFHQTVAQGAERVGLAGAGQSEGQHVDAVFHEVALGQLVQLPRRQGHAIMLEGLPSLARGEFGRLTQAVEAPVAAILGLLFQHLQEGGQSIAVASLGETGTGWAPVVSILNWRHNWPMRFCMTLVSVFIMRTPPPP